jgi:hypothetical protein
MNPRETAMAVALAWLAAATSAAAVDRPVDATKLVLKRTPTRETLTFVTRDPDFLFPAANSADDPAIGNPGGMRVDLFSVNEGSASLVAPPGAGKPGWLLKDSQIPQFRFQNADAPGGSSPVRLAILKQARVLKVDARLAGLPLAGPQGAVGIRIVTGTLRTCALFGPATIKRDEPGRFVARNALAASITDCSDVSLGGPTPSTTTTSTTLPGCQLIDDPFEPTCGGACPPGEQCVGGFDATISIECTCIPDDAVACLGSGYPTCGGVCSGGRVCQAFHVLPGEVPEISSCACVDPGNTCDDPPGTCFAVGVCPPGEVCQGLGPPTSACGCGPP